MVATIMEKEGAWTRAALLKKMSLSKQSIKLWFESREKRPVQVDPSKRKIALTSSPQLDEEEKEPKTMLLHGKCKLSDQADPQIRVVLYWEFFPLCWTWH